MRAGPLPVRHALAILTLIVSVRYASEFSHQRYFRYLEEYCPTSQPSMEPCRIPRASPTPLKKTKKGPLPKPPPKNKKMGPSPYHPLKKFHGSPPRDSKNKKWVPLLGSPSS
jgi:hypothetical protein